MKIEVHIPDDEIEKIARMVVDLLRAGSALAQFGPTKQVYTVPEAAEILKVSSKRLYELTLAGETPSVRPGNAAGPDHPGGT